MISKKEAKERLKTIMAIYLVHFSTDWSDFELIHEEILDDIEAELKNRRRLKLVVH